MEEPIEIPAEDIIEKKDKYNEEFYYKVLNQNRIIHVYDDICSTSADILVTKIKVMNILNKKLPITIEINSCGGSVPDGFTIINAIENSEAPIHTVITGQCCSMASLISITGKKRSIYYNSYWMNHPISEGSSGDYLQFIKDRTEFLTHLDKVTRTLLQKYTKLNTNDLKRIDNGELWLSARECLKKRIVDKIL